MADPFLLMAGAKFLGGIFARRQASRDTANANAMSRSDIKQARKWALRDQREHFTRARAAAEAGGFNPLSVVGAFPSTPGGMVGSYSAPPLASLDFLTQGVHDLGMELTGQAAVERENLRLRNNLMSVELEQLRAGGAAAQVRSAPGSAALATTRNPLEEGRETVTNPNYRGSNNYSDPRRPDAESIEARYGDVAQEVGGMANAISDGVYSARINAIASKHGREAADAVHAAYGDPVNYHLSFAEVRDAVLGTLKKVPSLVPKPRAVPVGPNPTRGTISPAIN